MRPRNLQDGQRVLWAVIVILALSLGLYLRTINMRNIDLRSPDEYVYTDYAGIIADNGFKIIPELTRKYNSEKEMWKFPPPTRVGYLLPLAQVMKISISKSREVGALISFTFSCASLIILLFLGLRFFNLQATFYALLFFAVSPIDLALARRTWQDSMIGCLALALIYCCCEFVRNTERLVWYLLFILIGSYGILIKELFLLVYLLCLGWIIYALFTRKCEFSKMCFLLAAAILGICASFFVIIRAAGGIEQYISVLKNMNSGGAASGYGLQYQEGPWYLYLYGFWVTSALSAIFFIIAIIGVSFSYPGHYSKIAVNFLEDGKRGIASGLIAFILLYGFFFAVSTGLKNYRWASPLLASSYMVSGLGFWYFLVIVKHVFKGVRLRILYIVIIILVAAGAVRDYRVFDHIFVKLDALDMSLRMIVSP